MVFCIVLGFGQLCRYDASTPAQTLKSSPFQAFQAYTAPYGRWLPEEQRCEPDICRGLQLGDIPDVSGNLPASLLCAVSGPIYRTVFGQGTVLPVLP